MRLEQCYYIWERGDVLSLCRHPAVSVSCVFVDVRLRPREQPRRRPRKSLDVTALFSNETAERPMSAPIDKLALACPWAWVRSGRSKVGRGRRYDNEQSRMCPTAPPRGRKVLPFKRRGHFSDLFYDFMNSKDA